MNYIQTNQLNGHLNVANTLIELKSDYLTSGSSDMTIKIWNKTSGLLIKTMTGHSNSIYNIKELPSGLITSVSTDQTLKVWNTTTGEMISSFNLTQQLYSLKTISSNLVAVETYSSPFNIYIINTETGLKNVTLTGHTNYIYVLKYLSTGELASGSGDTTIKIWNTTSGLLIKTLTGNTRGVLRIIM
jgi:WD40 repeat protein